MSTYFDNASTTMVDSEVIEAMNKMQSFYFGNPSNTYNVGVDSANVVEKCREYISNMVGCNPDEIYFTSGGSEGDNWIIKGFAFENYVDSEDKALIVTSKVEHSAVLESCKWLKEHGFADIVYLNVDKNCIVDTEELSSVLEKNIGRKTLVSIMSVNNETGAVQPIDKIRELTMIYDRNNNVFLHSDMTQGIPHLSMEIIDHCDAITCSAHKFRGPKGVGFAMIRGYMDIDNLIHGGSQEFQKRAGTENVAGVVGMTVALKKVVENDWSPFYVKSMSDYISAKLSENDCVTVNCDSARGASGILSVTVDGINAATMQSELEKRGFIVGTGSACHSGRSTPSHVLKAIGLSDKDALNTFRISVNDTNTPDICFDLVRAINDVIEKKKQR